MPTIVHDLKSMVSDLNSKIAAALESKQGEIRSALGRNVSVEVNSAALQQVTQSLIAAQLAKAALQKSCCDQGCNIDWVENDAAAGG